MSGDNYRTGIIRIEEASEGDRAEVLSLYKIQIGREFCPWNEHYPSKETIAFDLSRNSLFIMREDEKIIAAVSIDKDEAVERLDCWSKELAPGGEVSRLAVLPSAQNRGLAGQMLFYAMKVLKERGFKSVHFLVNKHNIKAIRAYSRFSFNVVGECNLYDQDYFCYEKALHSIDFTPLNTYNNQSKTDLR